MTLGWGGIVRLGLVQTALGAVVVLTTSTLNRVMVVEMAMPAMLPGALVALHYAVQMLRPRMGHGSDLGGRRTPWIIGGMALLCAGGLLAAIGTVWMAHSPRAGIALSLVAFVAIGAGVGAAGTSLLVLLAKQVDDARRPAAATLVWMMMILGFALTAGVTGRLLDPFSVERLLRVVAVTCGLAFVLACWAVRGVERRVPAGGPSHVLGGYPDKSTPFRAALAQVWAEPSARLFTLFVFMSMLAYSAQDLILEPFAGTVFAYTPGESTRLSGVQHGGVLLGMMAVAVCGSLRAAGRMASLKLWMTGGCLLSALALAGLVLGGLLADWPLRQNVFLLGFANGAFAVAAIAAMMRLAGCGGAGREGVRMGLWGAAQAIAFALGGFAGTVVFDLLRALSVPAGTAYATVFAGEALLFVVSAAMAVRIAGLDPAVTRDSAALGVIDAALIGHRHGQST
ncbi:BCD family MFS transporter [Methyloversatilis thermotolerans]|uniref:BCD family MFS transporter n=1 Tax=Methyloversatilis thermotolerans TaxID=1346290 RepID=UPI00036FFE04|nr:BCD family MFS transporter [Methyloversatilis thermotolerans]